MQQALPAIIFAALRRFLGAVLFLGPRPSSRLGAPFWPSGLTLRSSGLAFSQPLTLAVRRNEMGEWSEYFEDFPEENSANYDERGRYCAPNSPQGDQLAQSRRKQAANQARTSELNAEIHAIIAKHKKQ